jgi:hypothetical protein
MRALPLLLLAAMLSPGTVHACVCSPSEKGKASPETALAFVGRPIKIEAVGNDPPSETVWQRLRGSLDSVLGPSTPEPVPFRPPTFLGSVRVTFEVTEYLKGSGPERISIMTGYGDSDCGMPFSISKGYEVYARQIEGALRTSYCFGGREHVRQRRAPRCSGS